MDLSVPINIPFTFTEKCLDFCFPVITSFRLSEDGLNLSVPVFYSITFSKDGLDLCVPISTPLTFPEDSLDLCVPVEDVDEDSSLRPDSWLAAVLATVSQLDVVHPEGGEVAALAVPLQVRHGRRLPAVKLEDLTTGVSPLLQGGTHLVLLLPDDEGGVVVPGGDPAGQLQPGEPVHVDVRAPNYLGHRLWGVRIMRVSQRVPCRHIPITWRLILRLRLECLGPDTWHSYVPLSLGLTSFTTSTNSVQEEETMAR